MSTKKHPERKQIKDQLLKEASRELAQPTEEYHEEDIEEDS